MVFTSDLLPCNNKEALMLGLTIFLNDKWFSGDFLGGLGKFI